MRKLIASLVVTILMSAGADAAELTSAFDCIFQFAAIRQEVKKKDLTYILGGNPEALTNVGPLQVAGSDEKKPFTSNGFIDPQRRIMVLPFRFILKLKIDSLTRNGFLIVSNNQKNDSIQFAELINPNETPYWDDPSLAHSHKKRREVFLSTLTARSSEERLLLNLTIESKGNALTRRVTPALSPLPNTKLFSIEAYGLQDVSNFPEVMNVSFEDLVEQGVMKEAAVQEKRLRSAADQLHSNALPKKINGLLVKFANDLIKQANQCKRSLPNLKDELTTFVDSIDQVKENLKNN